MKVIHKYPFEIDDVVLLQLPREHKIVHVEEQRNRPCIWALVDTKTEPVTKAFRIFGTGMPVDDQLDLDDYIATFLTSEGRFVWHLFHARTE